MYILLCKKIYRDFWVGLILGMFYFGVLNLLLFFLIWLLSPSTTLFLQILPFSTKKLLQISIFGTLIMGSLITMPITLMYVENTSEKKLRMIPTRIKLRDFLKIGMFPPIALFLYCFVFWTEYIANGFSLRASLAYSILHGIPFTVGIMFILLMQIPISCITVLVGYLFLKFKKC